MVVFWWIVKKEKLKNNYIVLKMKMRTIEGKIVVLGAQGIVLVSKIFWILKVSKSCTCCWDN